MYFTHVVERVGGHGPRIVYTGFLDDCRDRAKSLNEQYHSDEHRVRAFRLRSDG